MDEHRNAGDAEHAPAAGGGDGGRPRGTDSVESSHPHTGDGASPGKIFIGGLARETTSAQFLEHFGKYGEIIDSVIMKDWKTGLPRGFGFVTYADPSMVDRVLEETHVINGKQVEIKRTIPRGAGSKDFKTKKIFVGGIPATIGEDELKEFFSKFGVVTEHQIMRDHSTGRSRGFGFVVFESEQIVEDILADGNRHEFAGAQVEIKKAEPKKPYSAPPPLSRHTSNSRASFGGLGSGPYGGFRGGGSSSFGGRGFGSDSYRSGGAFGGRASSYGGYGGSEIGAYGGYGVGGYGGLRADPSLGYSSRFGGEYGRGYDLGSEYSGSGDAYSRYGGGVGGGGLGGYGRGYDLGGEYSGARDSYSRYGGGSGGYGGYDAGFSGGSGGPLYGNRGGYGGGGSGRYHPYGR